MSKSVLVIDTPENCKSCIHIGTLSYFCRVNCRDITNPNVKPGWCPLKPLPEKDDWNDQYDEYYTGYANGWNRCLSKITGEDDELC